MQRSEAPIVGRTAAEPPCVPLPLHACFVGMIDATDAARAALARVELTVRPAAEDELEESACGCVPKPFVDADGRFQLQLPGGTWNLRARTDDGAYVGELDDLVAVAGGAEAGLRLSLDATGRIRGVVRGMAGVPIEGVAIEARRAGDRRVRAQAVSQRGGAFELSELTPGRYDVQVGPEGAAYHRGTTLREVSPAGGDLDVRLARVGVLAGRTGRDAEGSCRGTRVRIASVRSASDGEDEPNVSTVDDGCSFWFADPPVGDVRVTVAADEVDVASAVVFVPDRGDASPVCLAGPCDGDAAVIAAWLVGPDGIPARGRGSLDLELMREGVLSGQSATNGWRYLSIVDGLGAGDRVTMSARAGTRTAQRELVLASGVNEVVLRLP